MAMASSLDQIGPLTRSVEDAELLFRSIASYDPMDSTSLTNEIRNDLAPKENKKSLTIGIPMKFVDTEGVDADVLDQFNRAVATLKEAGHTVTEIDLEDIESSLAVYYIIMPAEASTNLARFDGVRYGFHVDGTDLLADYMESRGQGFGKEVRRRILLGTYVLSSGYYDAYYNKAVAVKTRLQETFAGAFTKVDAIMTPTAPTPAFSVGEKTSDPLAMYLADIFTVPANLVGIPALSVPFGSVDRAGDTLPVGIQFMGPHMHEDTLFTLGKALEERA
jgi:aspartyl-tRNA(Asn)/glutamyl-tRNA(Gln) amidotransferase subunit A